MSFGSVALRDFYSKAISHSTQRLPNKSVPNVSIYYKYGEKEQVIPNCHLFLILLLLTGVFQYLIHKTYYALIILVRRGRNSLSMKKRRH